MLASVAQAAIEMLWPTRCAACDAPGCVLCPACRSSLPCIDALNACPTCGDPHGRIQCARCAMRSMAGSDAPVDECRSAARFEGGMARAMRAYKDQGEQRLAIPFALLIADATPESWTRGETAVVPVPPTKDALRHRGFDHIMPIAREYAGMLGLEVAPVVSAGRRADQRKLGRTERIRNMSEAFAPREGMPFPHSAIIVDDVFTPGATTDEVARVLRRGGTRLVRAITIARA